MADGAAPEFAPFTLAHGVALAWTLGSIVAFALIGRRLGHGTDPRRMRRFERTLGVATLVAAAAVNAWWLSPGRFNPLKSLPLELCDWAFIIAGVGLLAPARIWQALGVFWGLGLSTQALVTPTVTSGPGSVYYWIFWYQHAAIVGAAVYHIVGRGYRPTWRDYWIVCGVSYGYLVIAMVVNAVLGSNYGRVGADQPELEKTIVQLLGPWPLRVVWMALLVHVVFAIVRELVPLVFGRRGPARATA